MSDHGGLTARDFPGLAAELLDRAIFGEQLNQEPKQRKSKMADEKPKNRLEKIGSLWGHTDTNGDKFYAGEFTVALPSIIQPGMNVMVFTVKPENKVEEWPGR